MKIYTPIVHLLKRENYDLPTEYFIHVITFFNKSTYVADGYDSLPQFSVDEKFRVVLKVKEDLSVPSVTALTPIVHTLSIGELNPTIQLIEVEVLDEHGSLIGKKLTHRDDADEAAMPLNFPRFTSKATTNPFQEIISKLKNGFLIFECPNEMKLGKTYRVLAEIFKDETFANNTKPENLFSILVGNLMSVKLIDNGDAFIIKSANTESQIILDNEKTTWNWNILPIKKGQHTLIVVVSLRLKNNQEGDGIKDHPLFEKEVFIEINNSYIIKQFFKKNWQWIIASMFGTGTLITILKLLGFIS